MRHRNRPSLPVAPRLFSRLVVDPSGCLLWTGARSKGGYGYISVNAKLVRVHRVMYELFVGPIPAGLELDHLCRVRHCAAPAHLEAVTRRVNTLRGVSPAAIEAAQNQCGRGHDFDLLNTYFTPSGKRQCRACRKARST